MKKYIQQLLSVTLVFALLITIIVPAGAARPGTKFLSELHMAEAKDEETAKKLLTDNGYIVYEKNLNPGGDKAVYLGYKTSSDVEDAITDISVMNMNGGFNITDYETIIQESLDEYIEMIVDFRTAANEFAENYKAGVKEAKLAYRQLNYYYVEADGVKTKMGDYMLNFPEKDESFADILMKGNVHILSNIRNLLAMGTGDASTTIADKVALVTNDEEVYKKMEYYENAKLIGKTILSVTEDIKKAEDRIEDIKNDSTLTEEEKEKVISGVQNANANLIAFKIIFEALPYKNTTYGEYLKENNYVVTDYTAFYPILEAMTPGQRALVPFGQITSLLIYDKVEKDDETLEAELAEIEEGFTELSVYLGTDMEVYEGSFAVTSDVLRRESSTGDSWTSVMSNSEMISDMFKGILIGVGGGTMLALSAYILNAEIQAATQSAIRYQDLLMDSFELSDRLDTWSANLLEVKTKAVELGQDSAAATNNYIASHQDMINSCTAEYTKVVKEVANYQPYTVSTSTVVLSSIGIVLGAAIIGYSVYSVVRIINSYNVDYTDIPANMVENVETENGDRYIRYGVVNSFFEEDGEVKTKAGDTNGYDGYQWNAIYYTKNYEAGKCILASADWPTSEADFGKYAPVHPFGQKDLCYDLNDFTGGDEYEEIYLSFQTSNAQKAAAANVPTVVGSIFNYGMMAISGVVGLGLGMGIMGVIKRKKKDADVFE